MGMVRVLMPEIRVGPPRTRWRAAHEVVVTEGQALLLVRDQGAEIIEEVAEEEPPKAKKTAAKKSTKAKK